ncbi:MAG: hypothetical protein PHC68_18760 [Syntrophorhabdaceae bacterium]|nr:hypothetical protein [Syntrophorhabdaceae bacterium]
MEEKRINWKRTEHGWRGFLGKIHIFTIYWSMMPGEQWKLGVDLPGFKNKPDKTGTEDEIKEEAEHMLQKWLELSGLEQEDGL